jgi:hypothetical protein
MPPLRTTLQLPTAAQSLIDLHESEQLVCLRLCKIQFRSEEVGFVGQELVTPPL